MRAMILAMGVSLAVGSFAAPGAAAQPAPAAGAGARKEACEGAICWEIVNRFRLFQRRADFERHARAFEGQADPVLDAERRLNAGGGPGWAADVVERLCFVEARNVAPTRCRRDGIDEYYLARPRSFAVRIWARPSSVAPGSCAWRFPGVAPRSAPRRVDGACAIELRLAGDAPTRIALDARTPEGAAMSAEIAAAPRDILTAGMGDSFTSGEGSPDAPVRLGKGMCFNRIYKFGLLGRKPPDYDAHHGDLGAVNARRERIVTPSRLGAGERDCDTSAATPGDQVWTERRARWMFAPCHRSLYGHQLRAALALAVVDPHRSVTYIPLGCTGATIAEGLLKGQTPREAQLRRGRYGGSVTEGQLSNLANRLRDARRPLDVLFLSVGGNDVGFSGLVADVIVSAPVERWLLGAAGQIVTPQDAEARFASFAHDFARARARIAPLVEKDFGRVVFVPYGNPMRHGAGGSQLCASTRRGFDIHPAFALDGAKLAQTDAFVENKLLPLLKRLATCTQTDAGACGVDDEKMRFAETHRPAFREHGLCGAAASDPPFDACLRDGDTFKLIGESGALEQPFRHCAPGAGAFAPYAPRARWSRTVNDSFLTAMTFADSLPAWLKAKLRNDGMWGLTSMVYGGVVHPTAEGHAAMADAALIEAQKALAARGL